MTESQLTVSCLDYLLPRWRPEVTAISLPDLLLRQRKMCQVQEWSGQHDKCSKWVHNILKHFRMCLLLMKQVGGKSLSGDNQIQQPHCLANFVNQEEIRELKSEIFLTLPLRKAFQCSIISTTVEEWKGNQISYPTQNILLISTKLTVKWLLQ